MKREQLLPVKRCGCGKIAGPTGLCADCFLNMDTSQGSILRLKLKRFMVRGHAFVPMEVQIEIEAKTPEDAMKIANKKLKTGIRKYIVSNSEDEGAAFGFDALGAEEITPQPGGEGV